MLCRLIALGLLAVGSLLGQSGSASTSIYAGLFTNRSTIGPSSGVPNIGQVGHQVFLTFNNAPAHTCVQSGNAVTAGLQFSYDNVNWFFFGSPSGNTSAVKILSQNYFGTGGFPFVRFYLVGFDTTNCVVSGYYTGSSAQAALSTSEGVVRSAVYNAVLDTSTAPLTTIGGIAGTQGIWPIYVCNLKVANTTSPAPAGTILISTDGINTGFGICSLTVTSSGTSTVQIIQGGGGTCSTGTINLTPAFNLIAGVPFVLGQTLGLTVRTQTETLSSNNNVCIVITGADVNYLVMGVGLG